MAEFLIRKSVDIGFSHHIRGHMGACINVHGHTWKFEVDLAADELDARGFVLDFSQLRAEVLQPCHALLDHGLAVGENTFAEIREDLASMGTKLLGSRTDDGPIAPAGSVSALAGARNEHPGGMKVAVFPFDPTSERLAQWLFGVAKERLQDDRVRVVCARIYETLHPTQSIAEYRP